MKSFNMLDFIVELRGGAPDKCSFCEQAFDERGFIPEEAGDWVCWPCWEYWETHNGEARPLSNAPKPQESGT